MNVSWHTNPAILVIGADVDKSRSLTKQLISNTGCLTFWIQCQYSDVKMLETLHAMQTMDTTEPKILVYEGPWKRFSRSNRDLPLSEYFYTRRSSSSIWQSALRLNTS